MSCRQAKGAQPRPIFYHSGGDVMFFPPGGVPARLPLADAHHLGELFADEYRAALNAGELRHAIAIRRKGVQLAAAFEAAYEWARAA